MFLVHMSNLNTNFVLLKRPSHVKSPSFFKCICNHQIKLKKKIIKRIIYLTRNPWVLSTFTNWHEFFKIYNDQHDHILPFLYGIYFFKQDMHNSLVRVCIAITILWYMCSHFIWLEIRTFTFSHKHSTYNINKSLYIPCPIYTLIMH